VTLLRLGAREHVFILMMHHIICDRWSTGIVSRELTALYEAFVCGKTPALPPLPIQNGDYVVWQLRRAEADFADDLAYWEDNLRGAPDLLELPTDRPRPPVQSYRGARRRFRLNAPLTESLRNRGRQEKTSLYNIFTAVLNVLLYRYTGSEDVVVGIPVADRDRQEAQSLIGFLIDTHALRTKLSGDMPFRELLARVQSGLVGLYSHREIPFDQVVSRIQPVRNLSHAPLFQVMINCRDRDMQLMFVGLPGLEVESLLSHNKTSKFDFTLYPFDDGTDIWLEIEYSSDLFDEQRILRMIGHYQTLLEAVAADPEQCLAKLPLLTEAERQQLLVEWNATAADYPKELCVHQLFEQQVGRDPDAVAVVFEDEQLTYRQLNERANQLARHLQGLGVGPDTLVAICVERSLEMVVGLLAVLKAGGAYVPLDPSYPADRLAFMQRDSAPEVILSHGPARAALTAAMAGLVPHPLILDLKTDRSLWAAHPGVNLDPAAVGLTLDHLAYVIYTSGSTGTPKGVAITHRNVVRLFQSTDHWFRFDQFDVWMLYHSYAFDFSVWEMWGALLYGGRLVVVPYIVSRSPELFCELLSRERVTILCQTPSAFLPLMRYEAGTGRPANWALRLVIFGGETLRFGTLGPWFERHGDRRPQLVNMYGITETTVHVTYMPLSAADSAAEGSRIGRPIPDLQLYILDEHRQPVPMGIPGEMYIGGAGVARGYLNRPELTAERFIASPFVAGDRLYKTGDLGRYLADGNIEYLGRNDFQVKIRGYRIELGEIEARLSSCPEVREAVVLAREDAAGDKRLVGYYTAHGDVEPKAEALRAHLAAALPAYMVPAAFVRLDALPLTPNGKLDREALPTPGEGAYATQAQEPPVGAVETAIAEIWADLLGLERVGRLDNFFDLGGHSLLAIRVLAEMNRSFDRKLPLTTIYDAPTVAALASLLNVANVVPQFSPLVSLKLGKTFPPLFMVCGGGGDAMELSTLAKYMPGDRQIYGLYARNFDGISHPHERVEDMAEYYMKYIRELQPNGPYLFAGYCFGGLVALEMAHRFLTNGEDVAMLAFLETAPPQRFLSPRFLLAYWKRRIYEHAAALAQLSLQKAAPRVLKGLRGIQYTIRSRYFAGRQHPIGARYFARPQSALDSALPEVVRAGLDGAVRARRLYHPRYYPGTITFFEAEKYDGPWQSYATFWAGLSAELDVHIVPADQKDMVTTYAESLGAQLSLCIERVLGPEPHGCSALVSATGTSNRERALA
jgi:amino acid adenylation domain-containing protein